MNAALSSAESVIVSWRRIVSVAAACALLRMKSVTDRFSRFAARWSSAFSSALTRVSRRSRRRGRRRRRSSGVDACDMSTASFHGADPFGTTVVRLSAVQFKPVGSPAYPRHLTRFSRRPGAKATWARFMFAGRRRHASQKPRAMADRGARFSGVSRTTSVVVPTAAAQRPRASRQRSSCSVPAPPQRPAHRTP